MPEAWKEKIYTKRFLMALALVAAALIFWLSISVEEWFYGLTGEFQKFVYAHPVWGAVIFAALAALSTMISPFSSVPLVPIGVIIWGAVETLTLLLAGWVAGSAAAYAVGWYAGHRLFGRFIPYEKIEFYRSRLSKRAEAWLVFLFCAALPTEITGYTLGIIGYRFWTYLFFMLVVQIPVALAAIYASEALLERQAELFIAWIAAAVILSAALYAYFHKKLKN